MKPGRTEVRQGGAAVTGSSTRMLSHQNQHQAPRRARSRRARAIAIALAGALGVALSAAPREASAEPLRLRADALAQARAPVGLLVLQGEDKVRPWVDAEGLVWTGTRGDGAEGDVLVLTVRLREPHGYGEMRAGRFLAGSGAVRPLHLDGASFLARAPWGTTVEGYGGAPVVPRLGSRSYDWAAGGRLAQSVGNLATAGVAYQQRRTAGQLDDAEVGADAALHPISWLDFAGRSSWNLVSTGLAEAHGSLAARSKSLRYEIFAFRRSPSRLLPATSLFSVLGDVPATSVGNSLRWFAAPRLDFFLSGAGQRAADEWGGQATARATLRTDDRGDGSVGVEVRRQAVTNAAWSGVRLVAVQPIVRRVSCATELELVLPDDTSHGKAWPWGLVALSWNFARAWDVAAAVEASASRELRSEVDGLMRLTYRLEAP